jgi:hypothetical protein
MLMLCLVVYVCKIQCVGLVYNFVHPAGTPVGGPSKQGDPRVCKKSVEIGRCRYRRSPESGGEVGFQIRRKDVKEAPVGDACRYLVLQTRLSSMSKNSDIDANEAMLLSQGSFATGLACLMYSPCFCASLGL